MVSTISQKKKEPPKEKIMDEGRLFSEKWTNDYFLSRQIVRDSAYFVGSLCKFSKTITGKGIICKNMLPNSMCMKDCVIRTK